MRENSDKVHCRAKKIRIKSERGGETNRQRSINNEYVTHLQRKKEL